MCWSIQALKPPMVYNSNHLAIYASIIKPSSHLKLCHFLVCWSIIKPLKWGQKCISGMPCLQMPRLVFSPTWLPMGLTFDTAPSKAYIPSSSPNQNLVESLKQWFWCYPLPPLNFRSSMLDYTLKC